MLLLLTQWLQVHYLNSPCLVEQFRFVLHQPIQKYVNTSRPQLNTWYFRSHTVKTGSRRDQEWIWFIAVTNQIVITAFIISTTCKSLYVGFNHLVGFHTQVWSVKSAGCVLKRLSVFYESWTTHLCSNKP